MRKRLFIIISLICAIAASASTLEPVDYVNPLVGTLSSFQLSTGNTYPAIAMPWGMNFWVPQTGKNGDGWQYTYTANKIRGFKQTHQPSPWINDYGQFSLMPTVGEPVFDENKRASWFSHKAEVATPYYYKVYLADYDVTAEVAPTERAAILRFTFPETNQANVVIDAFDQGSEIRIDPEKHIVWGYSTRNSGGVQKDFKNFFVIEFDKPFSSFSVVEDSVLHSGEKNIDCNHAGAIVTFNTRRGEQVNARVASSFINYDQPLINLRELGSDDLETVKEKGRQRWNEVLGRIQVEDNDIDHLRTFYSCLYRSVLFPRSFYEIDASGKPVHYSPYNDDQLVPVLPGRLFTDTGFWDTFRSLFPLVDLMYPTMGAWMQEGLVNTWLESGFLPEWASPGHRNCMVGNNSASIVADAYLKGLRGYDIDKLWEAVVHGTTAVHPEVKSTGRLGYEYYNELGYIPYNVGIKENVARTLEYAYDDWCAWKLARSCGNTFYEKIFKRTLHNYLNLWDPETKFFRGRGKDGKWSVEPFDPLVWGGPYTEGNAWHYIWSVFHDVQGLIELFGSDEAFVEKMDSVFSQPSTVKPGWYGGKIHEMTEMEIAGMGQYAHGNQPIQHMPYLYSYAGQPWKTQYWVRQIMERLYHSTPDGFPGDEDQGGMSSWYVLSALGLYAVTPGTDQYVLGSPIFRKATITMEDGKQFVIEAKDNSKDNVYVDSRSLNGQPISRNYITYSELTSGGTLSLQMSDKPNKQLGTEKSDAPYSLTFELGK